MSSFPLSSIGITFSAMPRFAACNCHGTMFEWCSITDTITSSPSAMNASQNDAATRLMLSVVPRVKIISSVFGALMNWRTVSRAASCRSVARCER